MLNENLRESVGFIEVPAIRLVKRGNSRATGLVAFARHTAEFG
jgi:hypothetical protein